MSMNEETVFFLTVGCTTLVLAVQTTLFWRRRFHDKPIGFWVLAIWIYVLTDFLFLLSHWMDASTARLLSRILITTAYGALFLGAQQTAGQKPKVLPVALAIAVYAVSLPLLFTTIESTPLRIVFSRMIWGGFCFLSYAILRQGKQHFGGSLTSPATIFLLQGTYLVLRAAAYGVLLLMDHPNEVKALTYIDYANAAVFTIALFVALFVAFIDERNDEIAASRVEIQTLSGLLPICAWCKKLRADDGYWHEITDYLAHRNAGKITHGICRPCAENVSRQPPS